MILIKLKSIAIM